MFQSTHATVQKIGKWKWDNASNNDLLISTQNINNMHVYELGLAQSTKQEHVEAKGRATSEEECVWTRSLLFSLT
jgi:hypothetical protein